jgi:hypothetical protein
MSYHLTILRSAHGKQLPISLDEAKVATRNLGWDYQESPPTFSLRVDKGVCTLWYQDGELWVKTPNEWELESMLVLANHLSARVRGDEYETYETPEQTYSHPDDAFLRIQDETKSRETLSRDPLNPTKVRNYIVGFFIFLGIIAYLIGSWFERR